MRKSIINLLERFSDECCPPDHQIRKYCNPKNGADKGAREKFTLLLFKRREGFIRQVNIK